MRAIFSLLPILCLAACQHGGQNNADAVRQGVLDYLARSNFNVAAMDVKVTAVEFHGDQADMAVTITPKGQSGGMAMPFNYHLEHQNNKWVVVGHGNSAGHGAEAAPGGAGGANPHGGAMPPAMPGGANPHGGAMPPAMPGGDNPHGGAKMPSPEDLPPAKK